MPHFMSKVKDINQFLADGINIFKDNPTALAFAQALPWASDVISAASQSFASIKFIFKLYEKIKFGSDPLKIGLAACTTAFQRAVAETVASFGPPRDGWGLTNADSLTRRLIKESPKPEPADLTDITWDTCRTHLFLTNALDQFEITAETLGYQEFEQNRMRGDIVLRFPTYLQIILTHGELAERFKPFTDYISRADQGAQNRRTLQRHAELMCRIYQDKPVFGQEAFALEQVYIPMECGVLKWDQISPNREKNINAKPRDPFAEENGGRHDAEAKVIELIADPDYRDAIVIQGLAGSGKSSLSLHASLHNASLYNASLWRTDIDKARVSQAQLDQADCRDLEGTPIEPD